MAQFRPPPGGKLGSLKVAPFPGNPNCVDVTIDIDANVSDGKSHTCDKWHGLNHKLATQIEGGLNTACEGDVVKGSD